MLHPSAVVDGGRHPEQAVLLADVAAKTDRDALFRERRLALELAPDLLVSREERVDAPSLLSDALLRIKAQLPEKPQPRLFLRVRRCTLAFAPFGGGAATIAAHAATLRGAVGGEWGSSNYADLPSQGPRESARAGGLGDFSKVGRRGVRTIAMAGDVGLPVGWMDSFSSL